LEKLAIHVNLSGRQLDRLFSRHFGRTPMALLKVTRLDRAAELLGTSHLRVKEIMTRVGFNHCGHFVDDFIGQFGASPTEYRRAKNVHMS